MTEDCVMLSGRVPEELKRLVDADERDNQDVLRAALWREFGGERLAPIERRIEEKKDRIGMIERERNERNRELGEKKEELKSLRRKKEEMENAKEQQQEQLQDVVERLADAPRDPENPAIKHNANKLNMTPEELIDELPDDEGGLSSL